MEQTKLKESTGEQLESTALNGGQEANKIHTQRFCRKCLLIDLEAGKEKEIVYGYISELSAGERAGEALFQERLTTCRQCKWLEQATCQACGCFVEVRAAVRKNHCPYKMW